MGPLVGGASEPSVTFLPSTDDSGTGTGTGTGTLLAVFRVEQHTNLWQATSTDGGYHWTEPMQTNAWSVFPQLKTLANGATVLVAGRPGLGLVSVLDQHYWFDHRIAAQCDACSSLPLLACLVACLPASYMQWLLEDVATARWKFYNLAIAHNRACAAAGGCGVNSSYTKYEEGIVNATASFIMCVPVHYSIRYLPIPYRIVSILSAH